MAEGRKAVLQVERRTWDTEEYQRRADERREEEERLEKEVRARSEHRFRACAPAGPRLPDGATGVLGAEGGCRCRKEADGRGHCAARPPQQGSVLTPESSAGSACRTLCPRSCLSLAPVLRFALCPSPTPSLSVYACWLASAPAHTPDKKRDCMKVSSWQRPADRQDGWTDDGCHEQHCSGTAGRFLLFCVRLCGQGEDSRRLILITCSDLLTVGQDSISWLDHINGKKHNRALGMNMRAGTRAILGSCNNEQCVDASESG